MNTKRELRRHYLELRDSCPAEDRKRDSLTICQTIADFCGSRGLTRIAAFWPLGSELDLRPLIQGHPAWRFYFPKVASSTPPRLTWGTKPLEPGPWGLMEPALAQHSTPPVQVMLVPGLAFDEQGFRLGYGKGYYDAAISRLPRELITLAVGFEFQRSRALPRDPHDLAVQGLVTELGITWF